MGSLFGFRDRFSSPFGFIVQATDFSNSTKSIWLYVNWFFVAYFLRLFFIFLFFMHAFQLLGDKV